MVVDDEHLSVLYVNATTTQLDFTMVLNAAVAVQIFFAEPHQTSKDKEKHMIFAIMNRKERRVLVCIIVSTTSYKMHMELDSNSKVCYITKHRKIQYLCTFYQPFTAVLRLEKKHHKTTFPVKISV